MGQVKQVKIPVRWRETPEVVQVGDKVIAVEAEFIRVEREVPWDLPAGHLATIRPKDSQKAEDVFVYDYRERVWKVPGVLGSYRDDELLIKIDKAGGYDVMYLPPM